MATALTNLAASKPDPFAAVDEDLWGFIQNTFADAVDAEFATKTFAQNFADFVLSRPELKDYSETLATPSIASGVLTLDFEDGNHASVDLDENITSIVLSNPGATGKAGAFYLRLTQDATGSRTVVFPSKIKFAGGTAPVVTSTALRADEYVFRTTNGGTSYTGAIVGQDFAGL